MKRLWTLAFCAAIALGSSAAFVGCDPNTGTHDTTTPPATGVHDPAVDPIHRDGTVPPATDPAMDPVPQDPPPADPYDPATNPPPN